jgi:hypothetical protein
MSIESDIATLLVEVAREQNKVLAPLSDELGCLKRDSIRCVSQSSLRGQRTGWASTCSAATTR